MATYTAKRLGWDEHLTPAQEFDLETYAEHGYDSDDLEGELVISGEGEVRTLLVAGQEADPKTVRLVDGTNAERVTDYFAEAQQLGAEPDWAEAVLAAALDVTGNDLVAAIKRAKSVLGDSPKQPEE